MPENPPSRSLEIHIEIYSEFRYIERQGGGVNAKYTSYLRFEE